MNICAANLLLLAAVACSQSFDNIQTNMSAWHVVWVGGQSNSVGTNSQKSGYPTWPTTSRIQMWCQASRHFAPATVPLCGENNVGFSQTFANLLLPTLPADHGVIIVNTGVGGTGFHSGEWVVPDGPLTQNSVTTMNDLVNAFKPAFGAATYKLYGMLWHQVITM
jgi:hypothetical protein